MINQEKREILAELAPEAVIFDEPSFDNSIIGISTDGAIIYDYASMVEEFMGDNNCEYEEAADFIDYNTIRSIPYTSANGIPPIVSYSQLI